MNIARIPSLPKRHKYIASVFIFLLSVNSLTLALGSAEAGSRGNYKKVIARSLAEHKSYPDRARRARAEGTVTVRFTFDKQGTILSTEIVKSSGHEILDRAATQMLQRANPLPSIPDTVEGARMTLTVPVSFCLTTTMSCGRETPKAGEDRTGTSGSSGSHDPTKRNPQEQLLTAIASNDLTEFNDSLESGADATAERSDGTTALELAARKERRKMVYLLIRSGADVTALNDEALAQVMKSQREFFIDSVVGKADKTAGQNAFQWLRTHAKDGSAEARYQIYATYIDLQPDDFGLTDEQLNWKARKWLKLAANNGHSKAMIEVYKRNRRDDDLFGATDHKEAARWGERGFKQAMQDGEHGAAEKLYHLYKEGSVPGMARDEEVRKAREILEKHVYGDGKWLGKWPFLELARHYAEGTEFYAKDLQKARNVLERQFSDESAQERLADLQGKEPEPDTTKLKCGINVDCNDKEQVVRTMTVVASKLSQSGSLYARKMGEICREHAAEATSMPVLSDDGYEQLFAPCNLGLSRLR